MRRLICLLAALLALSGCGPSRTEALIESMPPEESLYVPEAPPKEEPPVPAPPELPEDPAAFVRVTDYLPDIVVELRYAGEDNFTGQVIYGFTDAYLRCGTVRKLAAAQTALAEEGLRLKIWDAFRPPAAQFQLWEAVPDVRYVADPTQGFSSHSRGNTVDLTLADREGKELEMPSGFDEFSAKADRDYGDVSPEAAENAQYLETRMTEAGFRPYSGEWWHYSDTDRYEVEEDFQPPAAETGGDSHG